MNNPLEPMSRGAAWPIAVIMCVSSACATANYLFGLVYYPQQLLAVAILINLVLLMKHLWELLSQNPIQRRVEAAV